MDFDELEKKLKKKHKKYFWSSALFFVLIVGLVVASLFLGVFIVSLLSLGFVIFLFYFFVRSILGMFNNHKELMDIWDEKIFVSKKLNGN